MTPNCAPDAATMTTETKLPTGILHLPSGSSRESAIRTWEGIKRFLAALGKSETLTKLCVKISDPPMGMFYWFGTATIPGGKLIVTLAAIEADYFVGLADEGNVVDVDPALGFPAEDKFVHDFRSLEAAVQAVEKLAASIAEMGRKT